MHSMRILHISKYYFPYIGGVENICKYLVEEMPEHETAVVCFDDGFRDKTEVINGHTIYRVGSWVNIARQAISPTYFFVLRRAIKEFQPDVIHFHWANPFPAWVLLCVIPKNVKLVVHWHMDIIKQKSLYPIVKSVETRLLKRAVQVYVTSPNYKEHSRPLRKFKSKVFLLPNAIDESMMEKQDADAKAISSLRRKYGNKPIVFFVGRHIQYKGLHNLIDAAPLIKTDCAILIGGEGPLTKDLQERCKSNNVFFVGRLSADKLRQYHYAAKIFAFPSITKNEAFGVALAEAMYAGAPAVTFKIKGSGVNWVSLKDETCLEVENSNVEAYAEAIDRLLTDKELWTRLSEAGIRRVKDNFLIKHMVEACNNYYKDL